MFLYILNILEKLIHMYWLFPALTMMCQLQNLFSIERDEGRHHSKI